MLYDQQRRLEAALRGAGVAVEPPFVGEGMPHVFPLFATASWGPGLHTGDASPPHPAVESVEVMERFLLSSWQRARLAARPAHAAEQAAAAGAAPVLDRIAAIFPESVASALGLSPPPPPRSQHPSPLPLPRGPATRPAPGRRLPLSRVFALARETPLVLDGRAVV